MGSRPELLWSLWCSRLGPERSGGSPHTGPRVPGDDTLLDVAGCSHIPVPALMRAEKERQELASDTEASGRRRPRPTSRVSTQARTHR